jgi:predicted phage baseplate assembly protein
MFVPLPQLDDRRWSDLVEESRALIPLYAPEWTDHNVSDPGITLAELFAWITEMEIFQLDQVPARHRRKFLALLGIVPAPPRPARTVLRFDPPPDTPPFTLPATLECEGLDPFGRQVRVRTRRALTVVATTLELVQSADRHGTTALTGRLRDREPFAPLGTDPAPGAALVLGLSAAPPPGVTLSIAMTASDPTGRVRGPHHSARTVWEVRTGTGRWRRLDPRAREVVDGTRSLTQSGRVRITLPPGLRVAGGDGELCHLRCRLAGGAYDQAPLLDDLAVNGVAAEQSVPAGSFTWAIAPGATIAGSARRGRPARVGLRLDNRRRIVHLDFGDRTAPKLFLLDYRIPSGDEPGVLTVEAALAGRGDDTPGQVVTLAPAPVEASSVRVLTLRDGVWRRWSLRADLDAFGPADEHAVIEASAGTVSFGDGAHGLAPPKGAAIFTRHRATAAELGNLPAGAIRGVSDNAHNAALLSSSAAASEGAAAVAVTNPVPLAGGQAAESLEAAEGRAFEQSVQATRTVTLADYEWLARRTPGTRLARVIARANAHPGLPCVAATGVVTVVVVPYLPRGRPVPSRGLLRAVAAHLCPLRLVGTRVEVAGPTYTEVTVRASVRRGRLASAAEVRTRVADALDAFFDPLTGGPDGTGWPLGRDVYRLEVMQVIDEVAGVEHVVDLELVTGGAASCGNLCIGPIGLVDAGAHEIEVVDA